MKSPNEILKKVEINHDKIKQAYHFTKRCVEALANCRENSNI